ncbi:MAG: hypothetical protein V3W28_01655 [Thermoplasmata archaeon]
MGETQFQEAPGAMNPEKLASYRISKDRIESLIRYLHTYTGFSEAAFREAVEAKLGIDLTASSEKAWVVVEMFAGLPEGVWLASDEAAARVKADDLAKDLSYEMGEDGYYVRGDSELHIREVEG